MSNKAAEAHQPRNFTFKKCCHPNNKQSGA